MSGAPFDILSLQYYVTAAAKKPWWASHNANQWPPWLVQLQMEKRYSDQSMCLEPQGLCFTFQKGELMKVSKDQEVVWTADWPSEAPTDGTA